MNRQATAALAFCEDEDFDPLIEEAAGGPATAVSAGVAEVALPGARYRWVHAIYACIVIVLIATAIPIQFPDLRASLIGGYGRSFATVHEWAGVAMLALPAVVLAVTPRKAVETILIRSYRREHLRLHAVNLWFTLASGVLFVATGFLMWFPSRFPDAVVDTSADVHRILSYLLYVMVPLHLVIASKRTWEVLKGWARVYVEGPFPEGRSDDARNETEDLAC